MSNILIEASNISKIYDPDIFLKRGKNYYALNNVNFQLEEGDFTCVMGPSGSGKSTLLNCLSTLDKISLGSIKIMDTDITSLNKEQLCQFRYDYLGFIFQNHNLIPYLSLFDNIAAPILLAHVDNKKIKEKVLEIAKTLDIDKLLDKFPGECSGGECQRAAIARALINNPKIIFCDEPTGNLDSRNSHRVLKLLSELNNQGTTILLVTHDAMIASYAKKMMYLYDGGIQSVIYKHHGSQMDFFKKINEITTQDSILKEFSEDKEDTSEKIEEVKVEQDKEIEAIKIVNKEKAFVSRQNVYMVIDGQPYDEQIAKRNTLFHIDGTHIRYMNQNNDEIEFDLTSIRQIHLNLKAQFVNFGLFSQFIFYPIVDMDSSEGTYLFKAKNKDDFIQIIQLFHQFNIPIDDPRQIEEAYKKYPKDYERTKFFQRTHKDLTQYDKADNVNGVTGKKIP